MKYAFIEEQRTQHGLRRICRLLEVSHGGYYEWRGNGVCVLRRAVTVSIAKGGVASILMFALNVSRHASRYLEERRRGGIRVGYHPQRVRR